ncbi:hypothetical protein [Massilia sp.]|uniref:hypothetical protein n=1 Tax=Massilia sp. TaxID=1882437 RepID=UPI00352DCF3D
MLDLLYGLEPDLALHAIVLAFGCATFLLILLWRRCPNCTWQEWSTELLGRDDRDDADHE